jgi:hypothetical protein
MYSKVVLVAVFFVLVAPVMASAQNNPPVADAGEDQTLLRDTVNLLDGTASDPDGDLIVAWLWSVESSPVGSSPLIEWPDQHDPLFLGDVIGEYVLSLMAFDGIDWSAPDFVTITVRDLLTPEAVIAVDVTSGPVPLTVQFDGSVSTVDPLGAPLIYFWSFGDASASSAVTPTHTYGLPDSYLATLTVVDDLGQSDEASVQINVTEPPPVPALSPPSIAVLALLLLGSAAFKLRRVRG